MTDRVDVLGVPFDAVTPEEAVGKALALIGGGGGMVVTPNPEIVWACQTDAGLREAVAGADLILADGIGVVKAAKKLGRPLPGRVPGIEWFTAMLETGRRVYLLGGKPGVAELAAKNAAARCPGLTVCGTWDGYFNDDALLLASILEAKPDFLAVCLGSPKQELWMAGHRKALEGILTAGLGGSLDVLAGTVKRAPGIFQRLGLEWLYRAVRQPSRIKRLFVIPKFRKAVRRQRKEEKRNG